MTDIVFDSLTPWYPLAEEIKYNVLISTSITGHEQRRLVSPYPRRRYNVTYGLKNAADCQILWDFYIARNGEYDYWYFPNNNERVVDENVGNKNPGQTHTATYKPLGNIYMIDDTGVLAVTTDYTVNKITGVITFVRAVHNCWLSYDVCVKVRFNKELQRAEVMNAKFQIETEVIEVL